MTFEIIVKWLACEITLTYTRTEHEKYEEN